LNQFPAQSYWVRLRMGYWPEHDYGVVVAADGGLFVVLIEMYFGE
jgi:hypothetical protein